jgi:hypothetical protein
VTIELPKAIASYFAADKEKNAEAVAQCFAEGAIIKDEGNTYTGREAIRRWKADSSSKYTYTVAPFAIKAEGGKTVVTSHVAGNFPGSPVDLRYFFEVDGDKITKLEIIL